MQVSLRCFWELSLQIAPLHFHSILKQCQCLAQPLRVGAVFCDELVERGGDGHES